MPTGMAKTEAMEERATEGVGSTAQMTSRFVGLVVVPGKLIVKLEVEEKNNAARHVEDALRPATIKTTSSGPGP